MDWTAIVNSVGIHVWLIVPAFLVLLTIVIFIHELGHFLVARWCGVDVSTFSIGFGPEIAHFVDRHGTRWRLAWLPLGGYVKFIDDDNIASVPTTAPQMKQLEAAGADAALAGPPSVPAVVPAGGTAVAIRPEGLFRTKSVAQRAAIVAAGPIANFILGILIFAGLAYANGERKVMPKIDEIVADGPAARAGFQIGDVIVEIDGSRITSFADMKEIVALAAGRELAVVVDRAGARQTIKVTPERKEETDKFGNKLVYGLIGIKRTSEETDKIVEYSVAGALWRGVERTYGLCATTLGYVGRLLTFRDTPEQLGSPIKIAEIAGQTASLGPSAFIYFIGLMSVSIGLFNLFPIPILDGGNLVFYAIEAIRQRPLSERAQEIGFRIGLALLGMLMVFVLTKDVVELVVRAFVGT
jgi:regulator of sigma E protease